jgi:hypothetical protein
MSLLQVNTIRNKNGTSAPVFDRGINVSGVSTLGNLQVSSGILTAATGIVTYYGDAQYLKNVGLAITSIPSGLIVSGILTVTNLTATNVSVSNTITTNNLNTTNNVSVGNSVTALRYYGNGSNVSGIVTSLVAGSNITLSGSTGRITINAVVPASGLYNVVEDTSPELGGNLNINSKNISGIGSINVTGIITATSFSGNLTGNVTGNLTGSASQTAITNDTSSVSNHYLTFVSATSGDRPQKVSSTGLIYNPSTQLFTTGGSLTVGGNLISNGNLTVSGTTTFNSNITSNSNTILNGNLLTNSLFTASGISTFNNDVTVNSNLNCNADIFSNSIFTASGISTFNGSVGINSTLSCNSGVFLNQNLTVSGISTFNNRLQVNSSANLTGSLVINQNLSASGISTFSNNLQVTSSSVTASSYFQSSNYVAALYFINTSDIKQKENISKITNANEKLANINGVTFDWKTNKEKSIGVIAQEVEKVFPELVITSQNNKAVNYNGLIGVLIEAVKELKKEIEELKSNK